MAIHYDVNQHHTEVALEVEDGDTRGSRTTYRVFYEDRDCSADEWEIEQLARAIYSSSSIIICLTPDYLRDKRRQYEMVLAQDAMIARYGLAANDHVILINFSEPEETASHVPDFLRHYSKHVILWSDSALQQRHFWASLKLKLSKCAPMK